MGAFYHAPIGLSKGDASAPPQAQANRCPQGQELLVKLRKLSRGALAEMQALVMESHAAALANASMKDLLR